MDDFARRWRQWAEESTSYKDHATKDTLAHLQEGLGLTKAGSDSTELGGADRIPPLLVALRGEDAPVILGAARARRPRSPHAPVVTEAAELLAHAVFLLPARRVAARRIAGCGRVPVPAASGGGISAPRGGKKAGCPWSRRWKVSAPSCPLEKALPASLAILWRHGDNPERALIQNVMAGGDLGGARHVHRRAARCGPRPPGDPGAVDREAARPGRRSNRFFDTVSG